MGSILLISHIAGGVISLGLCLGAVYAMTHNRSERYTFFKRTIGLSALFEVLSGAAVSLLSLREGSFARFCVRISFYLMVIGSVEIALHFKKRWQEHLELS